MLSRVEKQAYVAKLNGLFTEHSFAYIIDCKGLKADVERQLRHAIKQHGSVRFAQNNLAKLAVKGTQFESMSDQLKDVCILVISNDAVGSVKCVLPFVKEHSKILSLKAGVLGSKLLKQAELVQLGNTPDLMQSLGTIAALLKMPMFRLHYMVKNIHEKRGN